MADLNPSQPTGGNTSSATSTIVGILVALGVLGALVVYFLNRSEPTPEAQPTPTEEQTSEPSVTPPLAPSILTPQPPTPATPSAPSTPSEDGDGIGGGK